MHNVRLRLLSKQQTKERPLPQHVLHQVIDFFQQQVINVKVTHRAKLMDPDNGVNRKRIRVDMTPKGAAIFNRKSWQPKVSEALVLPILASCYALNERLAMRLGMCVPGISTFVGSSEEEKNAQTRCTTKMGKTDDNEGTVQNSCCKYFQLLNKYEQSLPLRVESDLASYSFDESEDIQDAKKKTSVSKARRTFIELVCTDVNACGIFCLEQLWGAGHDADAQCLRIRNFINSFDEEKEQPRSRKKEEKESVEKVCVPATMSQASQPQKAAATTVTIHVDRKKQIEAQSVHAPWEKSKFDKEALFLKLFFVNSLFLYRYFCLFSYLTLTLGYMSFPQYKSSIFSCVIALFISSVANLCWAERVARKGNVGRAREITSLVHFATNALAYTLAWVFGDSIEIDAPYLAIGCGAVIMGVYELYHTFLVQHYWPSCLSLFFQSFFYICARIVSRDTYFAVGTLNYNFIMITLISGSVGCLVGQAGAFFVLRFSRESYFKFARQKCHQQKDAVVKISAETPESVSHFFRKTPAAKMSSRITAAAIAAVIVFRALGYWMSSESVEGQTGSSLVQLTSEYSMVLCGALNMLVILGISIYYHRSIMDEISHK